MKKLDEKDLKVLRGISTGAGIFTLIVALTMLLSIIQLKTMDPLDNTAIVSIKEEFDKDPDNTVKAEQVRALDLMARKAYFSSRRPGRNRIIPSSGRSADIRPVPETDSRKRKIPSLNSG